MSHPLRDARDERGEVTAVEKLGGGMVEVSARLPHLAATARPGQFAQLRCGDGIAPLLRRPFSVAWTDGDIAAFVLAPVGVGTRILAALRPGDPLVALGPLGTGFTVDGGAARALCVSGGLGCAPFPLLVRVLRARGSQVTVVSGAATAQLLYPCERFARGDGDVEVIELTVDGSRGARGVVTDAIPSLPLDGGTAVYGCGPNPMLAALARVMDGAGAQPLFAEVSLEAPMGCGFGTCLGCALPVRAIGGDAWALCCTQGPVMRVESVAWGELMMLPPAHVA